MRSAIVTCCLSAIALAAAQTRPAATPLEQSIIGSWRSEDVGLDFPIWMVDTYADDGSVETNVYSHRPGKAVHHGKDVLHSRWRIQNGSLEVGKFDGAGQFQREGQPRAIKTDAAGRATSIGGWTHFDPSTTRPASQPTGGR